jgi:hypothetical protein
MNILEKNQENNINFSLYNIVLNLDLLNNINFSLYNIVLNLDLLSVN